MPDEKEPTKTKGVTERSTKPELWEAYNQLLAELEGRAPETSFTSQKSIINDALRNLSTLKLNLNEQVEAIGEQLLQDLNGLQDMRTGMTQEKQRIINDLQRQQQGLETEIKKVELEWRERKNRQQQEQAEAERQQQVSRQREQEEYGYQLKLKRRDEQEKFEREQAQRQAVLVEREQTITDREQEIQELERLVAEWPAKLDQAVAEAKAMLTKELTSKHQQELHEQQLQTGHEKQMAELKMGGLEGTIKAQDAEIASLKRQLDDASRQLKDMAVAVIESRSNMNTEERKRVTEKE